MAKGKHTGGRKPGSKNKATIERELIEETAVSRIEAVLKAAGIELSSILPLDYALAVLTPPRLNPGRTPLGVRESPAVLSCQTNTRCTISAASRH